MNDLLPPNDPIEALGQAYELLLEKALQKAHQSGALVHHMIEESRGDITALHTFSDDEVIKLEEYLKRDLFDAAQYLEKTEKELKYWLDFDVALIKREFWNQFTEAADHTKTALNQLKNLATNTGYLSGELIGLGTLVCSMCGEKLHFRKPSQIPSCAKCGSTHFHRLKF
jgi:hypothetical protein